MEHGLTQTANAKFPPEVRLAVVPGDHIGPEVIGGAMRVASALESHSLVRFVTEYFPWGAGHYLETGKAMPDNGSGILRNFDAILFGAHGDPARVPSQITGQGFLHRLRKELGVSVNVRPVKSSPGVRGPLSSNAAIDLVLIRENSEGAYTGAAQIIHPGSAYRAAIQPIYLSAAATKRAATFALAMCDSRRQNLTVVTKESAMGELFSVWIETILAEAERYSEVNVEVVNADAMAMRLVEAPERFDVILATNFVGDILSDLAAAVGGGIGLAPSASLDPDGVAPGIFEPVHGSAPDLAGRDMANPIAAIRALSMLLRSVGCDQAAQVVDYAVADVLHDISQRTVDVGGRAGLAQCVESVLDSVHHHALVNYGADT